MWFRSFIEWMGIYMVVDVTNKVIVITGASRGIGREVAKAFAKEQAKVVINYCRSYSDAESLFKEISSYNIHCMLIKADVTKPSDVSYMYEHIIQRYGFVDVLINNAGIVNDSLMMEMSDEQWKQVIDVNMTGTFLCCREFSKIMAKLKRGKIINIASLKGQDGSVAQANYAASKAGVIALTKTLAKELGDFNIAVNAVCPGFIVTDLNRHDERKRKIAVNKSTLPIDRMINTVVDILIYMASDRFVGVSGRVFNLDSRLL